MGSFSVGLSRLHALLTEHEATEYYNNQTPTEGERGLSP